MSTTSFQRIVDAANETKRRKQENYEPLYGKVYRDNEKITSQISISDHSGQIHDPEALGILNVQDSLTTLTTEHSGLKAAGGDGSVYEEPRPLVEAPNKYKNLKRCICAEHEGDKWIHRKNFSYDKRTTDGLRSWCRVCEARQKRLEYVPRWRRGV